jgi:hypothetical protein
MIDRAAVGDPKPGEFIRRKPDLLRPHHTQESDHAGQHQGENYRNGKTAPDNVAIAKHTGAYSSWAGHILLYVRGLSVVFGYFRSGFNANPCLALFDSKIVKKPGVPC